MSTKLRPNTYSLRGRLWVVAGTLIACVGAITVRAAYLQLLAPEFYQAQGDARFVRDVPISASRGMITDRNGEPLAVSSPVESIWANPKELLQHAARIPELADALGIDRRELAEKLAQRADREFVYLRRHMNPDAAEAVLARDIPGVHSEREFRRFYPQGEVVGHVLGYTNIDDRGQEGVELAFDQWLTGTPGSKRVVRDRRGRVIENIDLLKAAEPGHDLALSIDRRIQYLAYRELKAALQHHRARSGSMVVLDIPTGEIIAMVNQPSFNPNARASGPAQVRRNRAVTDLIEPGSVIKAVTVAAALENGASATRMLDTSPGYFPLHNHVIRDVNNYGMVDMTRLLTKSSNIAATMLALEMTDEHFYDVLNRFGYGHTTGSGFPGEAVGVLADWRGWGDVEKATISYGYGLSATPLQIAQSYAVIARGGRLLPPTFVRGGNAQAGSGQQVIDPQIARTVLGMLETVTGPGGTAITANVPGYRVAGKTGTTRISVPGGYQKRYLSVFAGIVPVANPRFAAVVVVHEPNAGVYYGGLVAAPVFQKVMDGALRLMDVPPDNVQQWLSPPPVVAAVPLPVEGLPDAGEPMPSVGVTP